MDSFQEKEMDRPEGYLGDIMEADEAISYEEYDEARELLSELTREYPQYPEAWLTFAKLEFAEEKLEQCAQMYKKCFLVSPTMGIAQKLIEQAQDQPEKIFRLASALSVERMFSESLKLTDKLVEMQMSGEIRQKVLDLRENLRGLLKQQKKNEEDPTFRDTEVKAKGIVSVFKLLTTVILIIAAFTAYRFIRMGASVEAAEEAYLSATKMKENFVSHERKGPEALKQFEKAEKTIMKVAEKNPDNPKVFLLQGKLYVDMDELKNMLEVESKAQRQPELLQNAKRSFEQALIINPEFGEAYVHLAMVKIRLKDPEGARKDLKMALMLAETIENPVVREDLINQASTALRALEKK